MEKLKRHLGNALTSIQLARNEMERLAIRKKLVELDEDGKGIIRAINTHTQKIAEELG